MKTLPFRYFVFFISLIAVALFPPLCSWLNMPYTLHVTSLIGIYIILCVGLNITIGLTGLLDLGFMAFYALGSYSAVLLSVKGISFWWVLPLSMTLGGIVRFFLGLPVLKLRGDYLAIVTLAFGEITRIVANNASFLTNGPRGLPRIGEKMTEIHIFGLPLTETEHFFYLIYFFVLVTLVLSYRLEYSRIGRALVAIREDELAAELSGISITRIKCVAFVASGIFGALAGTINAYWIGFVSPEMFTFWESVFLVAMIVVGGMGNIFGVLLGVVLLVGVPEILRSSLGTQFADYRMLVFGAVMIVVILFRPQGLLPSKRRSMELNTREDY